MTLVADPAAHHLVSQAAALVPMLRKAAPDAERARRVPDESLDALAEAGIFRMCAPRRYGGHEADFQTLLRADPRVRELLGDTELDALFDHEYHLREIDTAFERLGLE